MISNTLRLGHNSTKSQILAAIFQGVWDIFVSSKQFYILYKVTCENVLAYISVREQQWPSGKALGLRSKRTGVRFSASPLELSEIGYLLLPSRDMAEIPLKRRKSSITKLKLKCVNISVVMSPALSRAAYRDHFVQRPSVCWLPNSNTFRYSRLSGSHTLLSTLPQAT